MGNANCCERVETGEKVVLGTAASAAVSTPTGGRKRASVFTPEEKVPPMSSPPPNTVVRHWSVQLEKKDASARYGIGHGLSTDGSNHLIVVSVSGLLDAFNANTANIGDRVCLADRIVSVNEISGNMQAMRDALLNPSVTLEMSRFPRYLSVTLEKQSADERFGIGQGVVDGLDGCLVIDRVIPDSLAASYNARAAEEKNFHMCLRPGLLIVGVNGAREDPQRMLDMLKGSSKIDLELETPTQEVLSRLASRK